MNLGVVLGGGGCLCAAELGMLQALAEWGITPCAVVGTSGGGIIAGALGAGVPLEALVATWRIVCANPGRYGLDEGWHLVKDALEPSVAPGLFTLQPALRDVLLHAGALYTHGWRAGYAVVTTDVSTGETHTLGNKPVCSQAWDSLLALQATSAFPGLFSGVRSDGALYQDGGLLDNVPANVAAGMGADRLLVMSFDGPVGALPPKLSVLDALYRSVQVAIRAAQAPPPDVAMLKVQPNLPAGAWLLSLSLFEPLRQAGYEATVARRAEIEAFVAGSAAA